MTPMEEFYFKMGAIDCLELFARSEGPPDQARMKRMYVQELMIPDVIPDVPPGEIILRVNEIIAKNITEGLIEKYVKPKVQTQKMLSILKSSNINNFYK